MEQFTISLKLTPANKAEPSISTIHRCYSRTSLTLWNAFENVLRDFQEPPTSTLETPPTERTLEPTDD